jgi:DNA-binding Lrp family transcriptional regulator
MDRLDIAILREMSQANMMLPAKVGLTPSYREMARKLGVSPATIRNRVQTLYLDRVLLGSSVYVNPNLLGLNAAAWAMDASPSKSKIEVIELLRQIEGILFIHNFRGTMIGFVFFYKQNDLQSKLDLFREITGVSEGLLTRVQYPQPLSIPSEDEWKLISHLCKEGFSSYNDLALALDMRVRTLKDRLSRVLNGRAILSSPTLNYRAIRGAIASDILVVFSDQGQKQAVEKIRELVRDSLVFEGVGEPYIVYNLIVSRLQDVTDFEIAVRKIEGVRQVRGELVEEHIDLTRHLANLIPLREHQSKSTKLHF